MANHCISHGSRSILTRVRNTLRGSRVVAVSVLAVSTAISAAVATAGTAGASTSAAAKTSASVTRAARASNAAAVSSLASRQPSVLQLAMLREREQWSGRGAPARLGAITGTVVGFDGQPVAGACVTAVATGRTITAAAAPDGTFRLAGLPAGSYALKYRDCAAAGRYLTTWSGGAVEQSTAARVQVAAGQVRHVAVTALRPVNLFAAIAAQQASFRRELAAGDRDLPAAAAAKTGKIAGKVTGKGKPLSGICVTALTGQRVDRLRRGRPQSTAPIRCATSRRASITSSLPGPSAQPAGTGCCRSTRTTTARPLCSVAGQSSGSAPVTRLPGINGNLRLGGEISGTVTSKSGAKLRGICVIRTRRPRRLSAFGFGEITRRRTASTTCTRWPQASTRCSSRSAAARTGATTPRLRAAPSRSASGST